MCKALKPSVANITGGQRQNIAGGYNHQVKYARSTIQSITYDTSRDLNVSVLDGNISESMNEFQRTLPEYTRLDLKRSVLRLSRML